MQLGLPRVCKVKASAPNIFGMILQMECHLQLANDCILYRVIKRENDSVVLQNNLDLISH